MSDKSSNVFGFQNQIPDRCSFCSKFYIMDVPINSEHPLLQSHPQGGTFYSTYKKKRIRFEFYSNSQTICHYSNDLNLMRLTRKSLVNHKLVDIDQLRDALSTNGDDNFIPIKVREKLGDRLGEHFYDVVLPNLYFELRRRQDIALKSIQKDRRFRKLSVVSSDHLLVTSVDQCVDYPVPAGFILNDYRYLDNEIAKRLNHLARGQESGNYRGNSGGFRGITEPGTITNTNEVGIPGVRLYFRDQSTLLAYIKEKPKIPRKNEPEWLIRLETRYIYSSARDGNDPDFRKIKNQNELISFFRRVSKKSYGLVSPVIDPPIKLNSNQAIEQMRWLLSQWCPANCDALLHEFNSGDGRIPLRVAKKRFRWSELDRAIKERNIIKHEKWSSFISFNYDVLDQQSKEQVKNLNLIKGKENE